MKQERVRRSRAQRRLQIMQAAYLKHSGYSHNDIVKLLRSKSFTVTRDLQAAEKDGFLETKTTLNLAEEQ